MCMTTSSAEEKSVQVVCGIVARGGQVLAARRVDVDGWEFPGGKVKLGETPQEALCRELDEELGVVVSTCWYFETISAKTEGREAGKNMELSCYVCPISEDAVVECREHAELAWLTRGELTEVDWLFADRLLAEHLGMWWDDVFRESHL